MRTLRLSLAMLVALAVAAPVVTAACTVFEPEVGARQQSSSTAAPGPTYGGYGTPPDAGGGPDPRCQADGGYQSNACDACENQLCCATRFACYDDPTCYGANSAFDPCIAAAVDPQGKPDPVAVKKCWDTFAASGPAATARVACQRTSCMAVCSVP